MVGAVSRLSQRLKDISVSLTGTGGLLPGVLTAVVSFPMFFERME